MDIDCNRFDLIITFSLNTVQVKKKTQTARYLHGPVLLMCSGSILDMPEEYKYTFILHVQFQITMYSSKSFFLLHISLIL